MYDEQADEFVRREFLGPVHSQMTVSRKATAAILDSLRLEESRPRVSLRKRLFFAAALGLVLFAIVLALVLLMRPPSISIHEAAVRGDLRALRWWLEHDRALVYLRGEGDATPLHAAAGRNQGFAILSLLQAGAEVNARDAGGRTALHFAAEQGHENAIQELLFAKPDIRAKDKNQKTALDLAEEGGHAEAVKLLRTALRAR